MASLDNKQLLNLIRYAPVVVVFVFALAVNLIAIQGNREHAAQSIKNLREELTLERKEAIRSEVHQVYTKLLVEKSKIENDVKKNAKQRVYEAYATANYIYTQNLDKSKAEVSKLIIEALRPARFFDGRGCFFILSSDGTTIMNGKNPELEGKNTTDLQDKEGHPIAKEMLNITKKNGEGVIDWYYKKPGAVDHKALHKAGYIKNFEPYNWSIGTGEYVSDFEAEVKSKLLRWFSEYAYGENGYFFVLDKQGTLLAHHVNDFLGLDFVIGEKIDQTLLANIHTQISKGGGYIQYAKPLTLSGTTTLEQLSYVKAVKGWDWIIGTGFNSQAFAKHLRLKEAQFEALNHQSLMRLIYLTIGSMLFLTLSSLYVGNLIARRFEIFQDKIEEDFNELNTTKDNMEHMALHDALTELPNRVLMLTDMQESIQSAAANNEKLAVMFVDLDNFKNVNDMFGHHIGDLLLGVVSKRFKALSASCGTVSRFGGDEFIFCFKQLNNKKEAEDKANLIRESLSQPILVEGKSLSVGCSIGIALYPDNASTAEQLISQADTVLYKSKGVKKGQALFYSNNISAQIKRRMAIEHSLRHAIEAEELFVLYQPQMNASDQNLVSVEALLRWQHPGLGHLDPDEFIPIAEEIGMIHDLGLFVFRKACEDIYALSANGKGALKLSVNISPIQLLEPDFSSSVIAICAEVGIEIQRITLELTENIFIHGFDAVQPVLTELRTHGFGLSLDDFGTGYSSLSYINSLPLTEIKIDRSFINKFIDSYQSDMLVRMIISIGRLCHLVIVAEGVETNIQFKKLLSYECDLVQGYHFDRPLTIEQLSSSVLKSKIDNDTSDADVIDV